VIAVQALSAQRPPLALARVSFEVDAGLHAILGAPADGGALLLAVLAGRERARTGSVKVLDRAVGDPSTARAIAYVPMTPLLPGALSVREMLDVAAAIRGDVPARAEERLDALGIAPLAPRRVRSLSADEARAVAIAEAITSSAVSVLLLEEPLVGVDPRAAAVLAERLRTRASRGACVVVTTASPSDAAALARSVLVIARGTVVRHDAPIALGAMAPGRARVRVVASDARALLAELARESAARDVEVRGGAIFASGDERAELAAAIARAVVRAGVDIVEMREALAPAEELGASALGAAAAAYEAAFAQVRAQARMPRPGAP
jgi:ABC-type multidrug transport system ATPase subunit